MHLDSHWGALTRLKHHAMQQKAETGGNRNITQMLIAVLKNVRGHRSLKAVTSLVIGIKSNARKRFSRTKPVMIAQHLCCFLNEPYRLFANTVVVPHLRSFPFGKQAEHIANTWGLIFC